MSDELRQAAERFMANPGPMRVYGDEARDFAAGRLLSQHYLATLAAPASPSLEACVAEIRKLKEELLAERIETQRMRMVVREYIDKERAS